ncbi:unnamed protein product [Clonostachys rosea]|uniref:Uncharacterized protein n=1 Tax=Bionectria ochroleuca TaxID=29856 RepID=A0ABY6U3T8_BIOOC|nr:unnamed protein product [Clonostachys rosea]
MSSFKAPPHGVWAPAITFFDHSTDSLDTESQAKYYAYLSKTGLAGLVILGTNAETFLLTREERKTLLQTARKATGPSFPIMAGVGGHSTKQVLEFIADAAEAGADSVLLLPPAYFGKQTTPAVIENFFDDVAKESPLPIVIYNFPVVCNGIDLDSATITRLAKKHSNIVGVKLTCGAVAKITRLSAEFPTERFSTYGGQSDFLIGGLASGSAGTIAGFANVFPKTIVKIYDLYKEGKFQEALELHKKAALAEQPCKAGISSVKYAAALNTAVAAGIDNAVEKLKPRRPYIAPSDAEKKNIEEQIAGIGSFYTFILSQSNQVRLTVIARSNYDAVQANGLKISSQNHGEHHVKPHRVVRNAAEAGQKFDYIVCAHKAIDQAAAPPDIAPGVDQDRTTIVIIQNGVGNEEPFRQYFPSATILSAVTWCGVRQPQPGIITHTKSENMQLGLFPNPSADDGRETQRLNEFASFLTAGKTVFQVVPNIQVQRWEKVVWNAAWNSLTTLTLMDTHSWLSSSDDSTPLTRTIMTEVINVAKALDVPIGYDLIDKHIGKILSMAPIGSSMRTDYENGKPMEVDIILGYPVRKGRDLGLDVKTIETLFVILTAINKRLMS